MVDGRPKNELLGMMSMKQGNAEGILEGLNTFMNDLGIIDWRIRLIACGTGWASVNVGIHEGLGVLLKREIPHFYKHISWSWLYLMPLKRSITLINFWILLRL